MLTFIISICFWWFLGSRYLADIMLWIHKNIVSVLLFYYYYFLKFQPVLIKTNIYDWKGTEAVSYLSIDGDLFVGSLSLGQYISALASFFLIVDGDVGFGGAVGLKSVRNDCYLN